MPNSTVLANIQLQIQDNLNPNQNTVNRIVPQFVYPTFATAAYSSYYALAANSVNFINTGSTSGFSFLFVKNVTPGPPTAVFALIYKDIVSTIVNQITLAPAGFHLVANQSPNAGVGSFTNVQINVPANGQAVVVEILYAV